ncbi:MAG: helix-turn-helix domain containing protein [Candidatus Pacebacteria bacterium]|nr:helix-turn-helix domain containing protein [Candidatus Paceibacterota bacterium]
MNEELKQKIIKLVQEGQIPLKQIAEKLFISEYQLKILLKNWNVNFKKREYRRVPMPMREELMLSYQKHQTTEKVAKEFGASINTINNWMKKLNIPTRKMRKMTELDKVNFLEKHLDALKDIGL